MGEGETKNEECGLYIYSLGGEEDDENDCKIVFIFMEIRNNRYILFINLHFY